MNKKINYEKIEKTIHHLITLAEDLESDSAKKMDKRLAEELLSFSEEEKELILKGMALFLGQ